MKYFYNFDFYDNKNNYLFSFDDKKNNYILIDENILSFYKKIILKYNEKMDTKYLINEMFIYSNKYKIFNVLFESNIESINLLDIILNNKELKLYELNENKTVKYIFKDNNYNNNIVKDDNNIVKDDNNIVKDDNNIVKDFNILLFDDLIDIIEKIKSINNKNDDFIYTKIIKIFFPLLKYDDYKKKINNNILNDNQLEESKQLEESNKLEELNKYKEEINEFYNQSNIIEFNNNNYYNYFINYISLEIKYDIVYDDIDFKSFLVYNDFLLNIFNIIKIDDNVNFIKIVTPIVNLVKHSKDYFLEKQIKNNLLFVKGIWNYNLFEFTISKNSILLNIVPKKNDDKIINKDLLINNIIDYIFNLINNHDFIKLKFNKYNLNYLNSSLNFINEINLIKLRNMFISYFNYFNIIKYDKTRIVVNYKLINFTKFDQLAIKINNYLSSNINFIFSQTIITELSESLNINESIIKNFINEFKQSKKFKQLINITNKNIKLLNIDNFEINDRIIFLLNTFIEIIDNKSDENIKIKIKNDKFLDNVTLLDNLKKNNNIKYYSRSCQTRGNTKIRLPIMYESINKDFIYDEETKTYLNKKTNERIIKLNENVYFGCDQSKNNITKHIGFLTNCSLCCFKNDQFEINNKKIINCWNNKKTIKTNKINRKNYVYKYPKLIGDISLMLNKFDILMKDYNLQLIKIGNLEFDLEINKLLFIDEYLINPNVLNLKEPLITIYLFNYPFYYQIIKIDDNNIIKDFNVNNIQISQFILQSKKLYETINQDNVYNFYYKFYLSIVSFYYIENTNLFFFKMNNGLLYIINDKNIKFGKNKKMFGKLKYNDNIKIPKYDKNLNLDFNLNFHELSFPTNIIVDLLDNVIGLTYSENVYLIFQPISKIDFNLYSNQFKNLKYKLNNSLIILFDNFKKYNILNIIKENDEIKTNYYYILFRYRFFLFLKKNKDILDNLLLMTNENIDTSEKYTKISNYIKIIFNNDNNISFFIDLKYKISIDNDISLNNKINITKNEIKIFYTKLINELIYNFSSLYNFISRFIDNSFSNSADYINFTKEVEVNEINIKNKFLGKTINNMLFQEIYNLDTLAIYRALSNIYYWIKNPYNNRNLGYYSINQTKISNFLYNILNDIDINSDINSDINNINNNNNKLDMIENIINIINKFNYIYKIQIQLIINNNDEINKNNNNKNDFYIYINIFDNIISFISVAFLIL